MMHNTSRCLHTPIRYTAAYVDYFDSEVEKHGGDWEQVLNKHLYCGPDMLLNGLSGGRPFESIL